ncbi:CCC motif membrane protein [Flavobacterium sp.]|uniref:CCC motif membrane protein n=1 Tax=Flavobacterium sp. TaxID=239 RepID=UPI0037507687
MENNIIKQTLPNSVTVLVLGICSIVLSCIGVGLILGIIGLVLSSKDKKLYNESPSSYEGFAQLNAGYIMSIIGTCLGGLYCLFLLIYFTIIGGVLATALATTGVK